MGIIEDIRAAAKKIEEADLVIHQHVVAPGAKGWTRCANCFDAVFVDVE